ncbi:tenascin [Anaeramoeba flamelloides]|uniref:Tenascin n=1 Tax=Anaeramoeba flamelloides TaxID=1746091 RepID=A0AAV7Z5T6_9EUKA|nr:tenascin [Anaeramoeba flamelloides]
MNITSFLLFICCIYRIVNCVGLPLEIYFEGETVHATEIDPEYDEANPQNIFRNLQYANTFKPTIKDSAPIELDYYNAELQGSTNLQYGGVENSASYDLKNMDWNLPNVTSSNFQLEKMILRGSRDAIWHDYEWKDILLGKPNSQNNKPLIDVYLALKDGYNQGYEFITSSDPVRWADPDDLDEIITYVTYEVPKSELGIYDSSMLMDKEFKITGQLQVQCPDGSTCGNIEDYRYNTVLGNYNLTIDYTYSIEIQRTNKNYSFEGEDIRVYLEEGSVIPNGVYNGYYQENNEIKWKCKWSGTDNIYVDASEVNIEESYISCPFDSSCGSECQIDVTFLADATSSEYTNSGWKISKVTGCQDDGDCGNGSCQSETHKCICHEGFIGENCDTEACPENKCNEDTKQGECDNNDGSCECEDGYSGEFCQIDLCQRDLEGCHEDDNQGECIYDKTIGYCECNEEEGYFGTTCSQQMCDDVDCNEEMDGGICIKDTGHCHCKTNFTGPDCKDILCPYETTKCNGHGTCDTDTGKCVCDKGYLGDYCFENVCTEKDCNNGECVFNSENGIAKCECDKGWIGENCTENLCPENKCNGHGSCDLITGSCECFQGWIGETCDQKDVTNDVTSDALNLCRSAFLILFTLLISISYILSTNS